MKKFFVATICTIALGCGGSSSTDEEQAPPNLTSKDKLNDTDAGIPEAPRYNVNPIHSRLYGLTLSNKISPIIGAQILQDLTILCL